MKIHCSAHEAFGVVRCSCRSVLRTASLENMFSKSVSFAFPFTQVWIDNERHKLRSVPLV